MKERYKRIVVRKAYIPGIALALISTACIASTTTAQVVCDRFKLVTEVTGSTLYLSVDTDLPDNTDVMVGVDRLYWKKGAPEAYSFDYFSDINPTTGKSTIGEWRSKRKISIDSEKWKFALRAKQKELSRVGLGFDVASISDKIKVSMVVPINQPDPRFGRGNSKLTGKAVRTTGLRVVEDEVEIHYPLASPPVGKSSFPNLDPLDLEIGQVYIVSKETPVMPYHSPTDPMEAILQMKRIPKGGRLKILDREKDKTNTLWYKVAGSDPTSKNIVKGWVNSLALIDQELEVKEQMTLPKKK